MWVAQGLNPASGTMAWAAEQAVAVAGLGPSARDRVAVWGEPAQVARLVAGVMPRLGSSCRLLGYGDLIAPLARRLPGWEASGPFGWMNTPANLERGWHTPANGGEGPETVRWLGGGDMPAVSALIDQAFPDSQARPGMAGVARWAGIDGPDGTLLAVAADAWSAPTVGYMSGVAVSEKCRGRGLGERVCRFVAADLIARHGRVALMVHGWNDPAIRLYQRIGLTHRPIRAAWNGTARG
ncbi:MAG: GNAT family N-acetyltransferase [Streptosporangiaceae bacterium]